MRPARKPRPTIADPERFRRHAIAAVEAFIAGDGADLIGHVDRAIAAMHEEPQRSPRDVVDS
ncbi:MAG: hypothetical protein SF182_01660 [Deltaproteobacteria bacterium]|nr:hypothetical protein [Deltaproteobacteria bacterium]